MNLKSLKEKHHKKIIELQSTTRKLLKNQSELAIKINLIKTFENQYSYYQKYLTQEVLAIQHELLRNNDKN